MRRAIILIASLLAPAAAAAQPAPKPWQAELRPTYVVLGDQVQSGGFAPQILGRRLWRPADRWTLLAGVQLSMFGFGNEARWMGIWGGVHGGFRYQPTRHPVLVGLGAFDDFGRAPVCSNLGVCVQYIGNYPGASAEVVYDAGPTSLSLNVNVRGVNTLGWSGAVVEPALSGRVDF